MSEIPRARGLFDFAEEAPTTISRRQELRRLDERKYRTWPVGAPDAKAEPKTLPDIAEHFDADGNRRPTANPWFTRKDVEPPVATPKKSPESTSVAA
jgi:hypothetical protein